MSNPARAPFELTSVQLALGSAPDSFLPEGFQDNARKYKVIEEAQAALAGLDMDVARTFVIPKELTVSATVLQRNGPTLGMAKAGVPTARPRTDHAKRVVNAGFSKLSKDSGDFSQEVVGRRMRGMVMMDGGTESTLGRLLKAYPKRGEMPARPVTRFEAQRALVASGCSLAQLPRAALRPFPLTPKVGGEFGVKINTHSDNGFPVLGMWDTPGAPEKVQALAVMLHALFSSSASVWDTLRQLEETQPWLVAVKGKAKADYYSQEKVIAAEMRFYNAFPRQVMLIMQVATQVLELNSQSILTSPTGRSGIGITLVHGGAADLIDVMESQLRMTGDAYVHVGDDSFVACRDGEDMIMFALDCSNFDLTQHATVTLAVHEAVRDELMRVDRVAAELWFAYARERLVVTVGGLVRRFKHAGPSGMPLQSKVNDMLMDVMVTRALADVRGMGQRTEEKVMMVIERVGAAMGFKVRLEQFWRGRAKTLVEALEQRSFLFIGYYFHVRGGRVLVHTDVPRTFAQLPFPALKWCASKQDLKVKEAMRLGSIMMNLGLPTVELDSAFEVMRTATLAFLDGVIREHGDVADKKLAWAVQDNPWGARLTDETPSLSGLARALRRTPESLWRDREPELPGSSELVIASDNWADEVEADEEITAQLAGVKLWRPALAPNVRAARRVPTAAPTHAASWRNDGRPPPTAVWTPPKAPAVRGGEVVVEPSRRARRKDGILGREFAQARADADRRQYALGGPDD